MAPKALRKQELPLMPDGALVDHLAILNADILEEVPRFAAQWSSQRIVLVVSRALANKGNTVQQLRASLGSKVVGTKVGVGSHSPYADVLEIAKLLQTSSADLLVCLGSGSYSDACKIARLLSATLSPEQLNVEGIDAIMDARRGRTKAGSLKDPTARLILVPCTLSAGEYNPVGSATHPRGKKEHFGDGFAHVAAAADIVLLDPVVCSAVPSRVWLESGARAIDHCVESIVSTAITTKGREVATQALSDLIFGLNTYKACRAQNATADDEDLLQAISACQAGARLAISTILVYGSRMGPSHAIGHQLGSVGRVAHGLTSCVCLPSVLRYEKNHPESEFWDVSHHGIILDTVNKQLEDNETDAGSAIEKFYRSLDLPTRLSEVGVTTDEAIQQIAEQTLTDIWGGGEPQLTTVEQVLEVLHQ